MTIRRAVVLRGPLTLVLESIINYFNKCSPAVRAAIFGALQDLWCSQCGTNVNSCKCVQIAVKRAEKRRSTVNP